ncbi:MAG: hypothetical protein JWR51_511 [Devosia sp.]|uniref:AraC family transcriptional regulator n=1 Tax=Devosia sp. TaxID=1871048 RepID=UPI0026386259|nr:AraC family transcriptional regulator [Devosia sp.]MDB5527408.1 hypothetical protein [Devosia sp.]
MIKDVSTYSDADLRCELETLIADHFAANRGSQTSVPGLTVGWIAEAVPPTSHMAEASVCICVRGSRKLILGETVHVHEPDQYLLNEIGLPTIVTIEEASPDNPYVALRIDLDLNLARQVMAEIDIRPPQTAQSPASMSFAMIDRAFLDAVTRLVRLINASGDISFLSSLIHREILYRLLSGPSGNRLKQIVLLGSQGNRVAKAAAWLREHFAERLSIDQLASMAGMGISTLHRHFHDFTGMSPVQYQKHLRLHEARRLMLEEDTDVGSTALLVGYESSTQFIREYRRLFGAPPFRHTAVLRATGRRNSLVV